MNSIVAEIFEIASSVSTPLAISGLSLTVLFFVLRQLLAKEIFPTLSRALGSVLLRQIIDRLFVLALVAMILGFLGYIVAWQGDKAPNQEQPSSRTAEALLHNLYQGDFAGVFEEVAPAVRLDMPFGSFKKQTRTVMSQFVAPPEFRHSPERKRIAGQLIINFEVEFDETSKWRETLVYAETDEGWKLLRFLIAPSKWPMTATRYVPYRTANELMQRIGTIEPVQRREVIANEINNRLISEPGWTFTVEAVGSQRSQRSCDLHLKETISDRLVVARGVLDGCRLSEGVRLTLSGRIGTATEELLEITDVRFWLPS